MQRYLLILDGLDRRDGLSGALVRDLLDALDQGAKGSVRLRLEGRSRAGGGFPPAWVSEAARFELVGLLRGAPGLEVRAPALGDALRERFAQTDLFPLADPSDTALTLMSRGLSDALRGDADSDAYDEGLLRAFEGFRDVFRHGVTGIEVRNGRAGAAPLVVTPAGVETVQRLQRQTPRPQRVRVAGTVDAIRHSDRAFTLVLASGESVRGVLAEGRPEELAAHFGRLTVVSGLAHFRPSGALLRIDADHLQPGREHDLALWSEVPRPLDATADARDLRRPQGPRSGINAIFGKWPGDETDDEIFAMIEEMS